MRTLENVAEIRRRTGVQRPLERAFPASALGELATTAAAVPPDSDVELHAVAEASGSDVVLTGTVAFAWEGDCRRCLQPVSGRVETDVREIFENEPVEGETWPVEGDAIDLAPVLRETVLLALPLVPLCAEDCPGPDPERFPTTVEADDEGEADEAPAGDPRWAALDGLRFDD